MALVNKVNEVILVSVNLGISPLEVNDVRTLLPSMEVLMIQVSSNEWRRSLRSVSMCRAHTRVGTRTKSS